MRLNQGSVAFVCVRYNSSNLGSENLCLGMVGCVPCAGTEVVFCVCMLSGNEGERLLRFGDQSLSCRNVYFVV